MKTTILQKMLLFLTATVMNVFVVTFGFAQGDPNKEILVYFTSGVERAPAGQPVRIPSAIIQRTLARFNINQNQITPAFPNFDEADTLKIASDGRQIGMPNMAKVFKIHIPDGISRKEAIDSLTKFREVLFAEPNGTVGFDVIPNDPNFVYQWGLKNGTTGRDIHATEAWDIFTGSANTKIAVIDQGVDGTHPDLAGKVTGSTTIYGYHGTAVAGVAAANGNNSIGIAGVNWNAQIIAKALSGTNESDDSFVYDQVVNSVNEGADVLTNSWKLLNSDGTPGRYSTTVRMAFAYAYKQNRVATASIGNTGNTTNTIQYPGSFGQGIIAVGAIDQNDVKADFSTYGSAIDVVAPGVEILSTYRGGIYFSDPNYEYLDGTSFSTPAVAGVASLLKGYNPNLYNDDIERIIQLSADDITTSPATTGWDQYTGYGRVNARKALDYLRTPYVVNKPYSLGGTDLGGTSTYQMVIYGAQSYGLADGSYIVKRHEVQKTITFSQTTNPLVWGTGVGTIGWANEGNVNFSMGWCDVVPGTVTSTSATLRTYVYEVWNILNQFIGWKPTTPSNVQFAYTVLGPMTAAISGPTELAWKQRGLFTPTITGGTGSYTYEWQWRQYPGGTWSVVGISQQLDLLMPNYDVELQVKVTSNGISVYSPTQIVWLSGGAFAQQDEPPVIALPTEFGISQNYPNPFNPSTTISYQLVEEANVTLEIYDMMGRKISSLVQEPKQAGYYTAKWEGRDNSGKQVATGVYLYRFNAIPASGKQPFAKSGKLLLTK